MSANMLDIPGTRTTGADVRAQNVTAVLAIANIVKTSLGPVGLDKVRPCQLPSSRIPPRPCRAALPFAVHRVHALREPL